MFGNDILCVVRIFGRTVAIPQSYKREIQTLVAERYQTAKEAWRQRVFESQSSVNALATWKQTMSGNIKHIIDKVT